jgi:hypothetical protein
VTKILNSTDGFPSLYTNILRQEALQIKIFECTIAGRLQNPGPQFPRKGGMANERLKPPSINSEILAIPQ